MQAPRRSDQFQRQRIALRRRKADAMEGSVSSGGYNSWHDPRREAGTPAASRNCINRGRENSPGCRPSISPGDQISGAKRLGDSYRNHDKAGGYEKAFRCSMRHSHVHNRIIALFRELPRPAYTVFELDVKIPMRDGILLSTNIYRPNEPGKYPALCRTPYGNGGAEINKPISSRKRIYTLPRTPGQL